jgi:hypothetical protein
VKSSLTRLEWVAPFPVVGNGSRRLLTTFPNAIKFPNQSRNLFYHKHLRMIARRMAS